MDILHQHRQLTVSMVESVIHHDGCYTKAVDHEDHGKDQKNHQKVTPISTNARIQIDDTDTSSQPVEMRKVDSLLVKRK